MIGELYAKRSSDLGNHGHLDDFALFPSAINGEVSSCHNAAEGTAFPLRRNGRKQLDISRLTLQEHFAHTCRVAEITVDLEWRMIAPKVVQHVS